MNSKIVFSALLLTVAAVFCVALFQSVAVSDLKKVQTKKHFATKAEFETELPKLEKAVSGKDAPSDSEKGKALFVAAYVFPVLAIAKKPVAEKGCGAPVATTIEDVYKKGETQAADASNPDKCLFQNYQNQIQNDFDELQGFTKVLSDQLKKTEAAIADTKIQEFVAQGRLSHAVCVIPYEKLTADILKDTSKDAANKDCLESVKTKFSSPAVLTGYNDEKAARQKKEDDFVAAKATSFSGEVKTECEGTCTVGTDAEKTDCKKLCGEESTALGKPLARLLGRLTRTCGIKATSTYAELKALYTAKDACLIKEVEKQKALVNNGFKLFFSALGMLALLIFGF